MTINIDLDWLLGVAQIFIAGLIFGWFLTRLRDILKGVDYDKD